MVKVNRIGEHARLKYKSSNCKPMHYLEDTLPGNTMGTLNEATGAETEVTAEPARAT